MAITTETIRRITIQATSQGVDQATASVNKLADAQEKLATQSNNAAAVTDIATKRQLSAAEAYRRQTQSLDQVSRSHDRMADTFKNVEAAMGALDARNKGSLAAWDMNRFRLNAFTKEMQGVGFAAPVVTAVLKRTRDGFVQIQDAADPAAQSVNTLTTGLNAVVDSADPASKATSGLVSQLTLLTGAGIVGGLLVLYKSFKDLTTQIAEMGEVSKRAFPDIERFQALRIGAGVSGVSGSAFDSGVSEVAKRLNDARRDTNELTKLLDANNIRYKEGNTLLIDTNRLLVIGSDLVKRASSEQDKFKIAEMLGLTKEWVPFLEKGSVALEQAADEATKLGLVIDASVVKKAGEFDEQWKRSSALVSAYIRAWLAESIPLVDEFINKSSEFVGVVKKAISDAGGGLAATQVMEDASKNAASFSQMLKLLKDDWNGIPGVTEAADRAVKSFFFGTKFEDQIQLRVDGLNKLKAAFLAVAALEAQADVTREANRGRALGSLPSGPRTNIPGKAAGDEAKNAWDRALESLSKYLATQQAEIDAVGKSVGEREKLRREAQLFTAAELAGKERTAELTAEIGKQAQKAGDLAMALERARIKDAIKFDTDTLLLSPENVRIAQQLKAIYPDVTDAIGSTEAAQIKFNNAVHSGLDTARNAAQGFVQTLAHGLMDGKNGTDILIGALDQLKTTLLNSGIQDLFSGNPMQMAIGGVKIATAFVVDMISDDMKASKELEENKRKWAEMRGELEDFNAAAAGFDLSPLAKEIRDLANEWVKLADAAMKAGDMAGAEEIHKTFEKGVGRIVNEWVGTTAELSEGGKKLVQVRSEADQMFEALRKAGMSVRDAGSWIDIGLTNNLKRVRAEIREGLGADINSATGKGFLNDIGNIVKRFGQMKAELGDSQVDPALLNRWFSVQVQAVVDGAGLVGSSFDDLIRTFPELAGVVQESSRAMEEAAKRQQSFQDRLFEAQTDANTLEGQLALLDRRQQLEREEELKANGRALNDLLAAQAAERFNVEKQFHQKEIDEAKRAAQEKLDAETRAARGIVDYVSSLQVGPESSLPPAQRLGAAQQTYASILTLAQQGNADALGRITSDFENLRKAAQAFYGSSAGYQNILTTGITQLTNLPGVATSANEVVGAVRDVVTAVNQATIAVGGTTAAVGGTTTAVGGTTSAIGGGAKTLNQLLVESVANLITSIEKFSAIITGLGDIVNKLQAVFNSEGLLVEIKNLSFNSKGTLIEIKDFNNRTINALNGLGDRISSIGTSHSGDFMDMRRNLFTIKEQGGGGSSGGGTQSFWNWLGFQRGGIVGAYAPGGIVGNGMSNVDSVLARYAGGGYIGLAGGEGILNQTTTKAIGADAVNFMNRTHSLPMGANDNSIVVAELRALRAEVAALKSEMRANTIVTDHGNTINLNGHAANVRAVRGEVQAIKAEARHDRMNPQKKKAAS